MRDGHRGEEDGAGEPLALHKFLETVMNWFKKKPSGNTSVPQREALVDLDAMSSEEHIMAAENVMACRDLANMLLNIIDDHRDNGHECLPYCIPTELHEELEDLDHFELKM